MKAFIASLRRIAARRGRPGEMHSDNGTNCVNAKSELHELSKFFDESQHPIVEKIAEDGIKWSFIPPHSPHLGGI